MLDTYDDAIAYLERLVASPVQAAFEAGPARARLLLTRAGAPQERFATLHVTGSAGKGSTATLAATILRAAGYRTGLFTSPHLRDYTERIRVDGAPIPRADWTRLLERLRPSIEEMFGGAMPDYALGRPAFMEVLWTLAALYFAERAVDIAVVEVGVGGRYDPTVVNSARVGVITNVSLEHTRRLGPTVAAIAAHKAGIVKPHGILVTAAADPSALQVIADECARQRATLWRVTPAEGGGAVRYAATDAGLRLVTPVHTYKDLHLGLLGRHQWANAACAVGAVDALGVRGVARVAEGAVRRGLAETRMPGRLEWIAGDPPVLLDGAHTPDAARALAAALPEILPQVREQTPDQDQAPETRPVLLLGILGDKDIPAMVGALAPLAGAVIVTEPPWERRAGAAAIVAAEVQRYLPAPDVTLITDYAMALAQAQDVARARGVPLVVTGSLILVGASRSLLATS